MSKHSQEEWKQVTEGGGVTYIMAGKKYVATMNTLCDGYTNEDLAIETIANADLVAASPNLLKACELMLSDLNGDGLIRFATEAAIIRALRKAKPTDVIHAATQRKAKCQECGESYNIDDLKSREGNRWKCNKLWVNRYCSVRCYTRATIESAGDPDDEIEEIVSE